MKSAFSRVVVALAVGLASAASVMAANDQRIEIAFAAEINGEPFACGRSYGPVGLSRTTITPSDYRVFVSEVSLISRSGALVPLRLEQDEAFQIEDLALLDFEDGSGPCRHGSAALNKVVRGFAPVGDHVGLQLTIGVPFRLNHGDPTIAAAPLSSTAMFWNWQGGYKFIRFDAASSSSPALPISGAQPGSHAALAAGFPVHLGSTRCAGPSRTAPPIGCENGNRITIRFDQFDPSRQTVVIDIGKVLADSDVTVNAPKTSPGCMSFPGDADCVPVMRAFGLAYDGAPGGAQRLVSIR